MNSQEELKQLFDKIAKNEIIYTKSMFNNFIITVSAKNYNRIRLRDNAKKRREKRLREGKCVSCGSEKLKYKDEVKKIKYRKCETCRAKENEQRKKRYYKGNFA